MNSSDNPSSRLDRLIHQPFAMFVAFGWGLAEATWFFIVPDVLLTLMGCRSVRAGSKAGAAALAGALLGGTFMYYAGSMAPEILRSWLTQSPAVHPALIERVQSQLTDHGVGALLLGPALGIPYKIYAAECGARSSGLLPFLLVSIPARGLRFLLSVLVANGLARLLARWTKRQARTETVVLVLLWAGFYTFYFIYFGW